MTVGLPNSEPPPLLIVTLGNNFLAWVRLLTGVRLLAGVRLTVGLPNSEPPPLTIKGA